MPQPFKTPITDLFGIKLPVIAGGLQWLANADYVAAAANAGIIGFITAAKEPAPAAEISSRTARMPARIVALGKPVWIE